MINTTIKNRFFCMFIAFVVAICIIPSTKVCAYNSLDGGFDYVEIPSTILVDGNYYGLGKCEGVTVLANSYPNVLIEFNTLDGPKQAWVHNTILAAYGRCYLTNSVYGYVNTTSNTYYSPDWSLYAGSVNKGENVAVLAYKEGWAYIEYNVDNALRKRAYVPATNISFDHDSRLANYFYQDHYMAKINLTTTQIVYSGPNAVSYATIGEVYPSDSSQIVVHSVYRDCDDDTMFYISYPTTNNSIKYGYIYGTIDMLYNIQN